MYNIFESDDFMNVDLDTEAVCDATETVDSQPGEDAEVDVNEETIEMPTSVEELTAFVQGMIDSSAGEKCKEEAVTELSYEAEAEEVEDEEDKVVD